MYANKSLAVVIPAYNEAAFVGSVIETVPAFVDTTVVVDDHSTDGTWPEILSYTRASDADPSGGRGEHELANDGGEIEASDGADVLGDDGGEGHGGDVRPEWTESVFDTGLIAVRHAENTGRGGAVKTGYRLALAGGHDVVAVMDGDGQMDPDVLDRIVHPVAAGDADYAKGNRLVSRRHCTSMSNWRLFGNALLSVLTKIASGHWELRDPQNGYTAISAEALEELAFDDLYDEYGFLNDVLIRTNYHGLRVVDVPIEAVYEDEESGIRYRTFVPNLSMLLLRGFLWRVWGKYVARDAAVDWTDEDVG